MLLYIPMDIKRYIVRNKGKDPSDEIANYIVNQMKMLKFGIQMLKSIDAHIAQVVQEISHILQAAEAFL